ncbi:MAG TPA: hypothetical protein VGG41_05830 [Solirubrobacteraceae bacterium]
MTAALRKLSVDDWLVGGVGIVLLVGLLLFPWISTYPFAFHYTAPATDGPGAGWAVVAAIILFWVIVELGLARFSSQFVLMIGERSRERNRGIAVALIVVLMIIRLLWHTGDWGWGRYVDLVLLAIVFAGATRNTLRAR